MDRQEESLKDIFLTALEIEDAGQRTLYLAEACRADAVLRADVEDLIKAHFAAGQFLPEHSATKAQAKLFVYLGEMQSHKPTEQIGERISHYSLKKKIGEGGCGVVYEAEQERPIRRHVAVKILKLGMDG